MPLAFLIGVKIVILLTYVKLKMHNSTLKFCTILLLEKSN